MTAPDRRSVTRPRKQPTVDEVYDAMDPGRAYVAADLREHFSQHSPAHNTIRNRLAELVEGDRVERIEHVNGTVTYRRPE